MIDGHKVIAVTPAGRRQTLSILAKYIKHYLDMGVIDEWHLWENTNNDDDKRFIALLEYENKNISVIGRKGEPDKVGTASNIKFYYEGYCEPNTVYLRIDDDICYMDPEGLEKFIEYRIANPQYFLVYPIIINNCAMSYKLQQNKIIPPTNPMIGGWKPEMGYPECYKGGVHPLDPVGWGNPQLAYIIQSELIHGNENKFKCGNWEWSQREHCCINFISWLGEAMKDHHDKVEYDEEIYLTQKVPAELNKYNGVYGGYVVGHYSFYVQKSYLDKTDLLEKYRARAEELFK